MKFALIACALIAFAASSSNALTTNDLLTSIVQQQEQAFSNVASLASGHDHEHEKHGAYALIKYIVVPSKAKSFISVIEEAKKDAEGFKGYKAYDLVKTVDDNITYIAWAAWESAEDLIDYIKSDAARKVIEYISKEDIVALISGVRPIV